MIPLLLLLSTAACPDAEIGEREGFVARIVAGHGEIRSTADRRLVRTIKDDAASCEALSEATALALSVIAEEAREQTLQRRRTLESAVSQPAAARDYGALGVDAQSGVAIALGPDTQPIVSGRIDWRLGSFALALGVLHTFSATQKVDAGRAEMAVTEGTLGVCYEPELIGIRLRASLCAALWLGAADASTSGLTQSWHISKLTGHAVPSIGARGAISRRVDWLVSASMPVALIHPGFEVLGFGQVLQTPALGFLASAGLALWIL